MLPWKETSVESERLRFIERVLAGEEPIAELCRRWAISRKTGYKLIRRYGAYGEDGLRDRSRVPHHHPNATTRAVSARILEAKRAHLTWDPKKIVAWLRNQEPDAPWPSNSTAGAILDRAGLVRRRRRRRRSSPWGEPFAHAAQPNDVWAIDLKGWFRTGDGIRIDPLTAQDAMSRYLLVCDGLAHPTGLEIRPVLERAFREYGLPRVIRTDNGPPFASVGLGSLSPLSAWWVKLGIIPERIAPGHPEQNGRLERLHRTLKAETASPPRANPERAATSLRWLSSRLQRRTTARGPGTATAGQALHTLTSALSVPASHRRSTERRSRCGGCATTVRSNGKVDTSTSANPSQASPSASSSGPSAPGNSASVHSSSASSTTLRGGSTRRRRKCYLCP